MRNHYAEVALLLIPQTCNETWPSYRQKFCPFMGNQNRPKSY